jgi:tRNA-2-methylthio-N6-dimethylallyladenosine synthase
VKYHIEVHGCQMNVADAQRVATVCERNGFQATENWRESDIVLYLSCSIKQKAEDKILGHMGELSQLKRRNPRLRVGISGCMVRKTSTREDPDRDPLLDTNKTVDFVFRMEDLDQVDYLLREKTPNDVGRTFGDPNYLRTQPKLTSSYRGYLPIMTGCDNFCTFCIVPYSRGRERSRLMSEIIEEAKSMASQGITEILLIGQNVNSYGNKTEVYDEIYQDDQLHHPFTRLLMEVNKIDGLRRIRYTSPHPKNMSEELIRTMGELDKVCEHVHLPLQSGDDQLLKKMNRHYSAEHFLSLVRMIRRYMPRAGISTDVIVGFSGETEEQFQNTMRVGREAQFDMSYTSMYSERKQTYAGKFLQDDISKGVKNDRYHAFNDLVRSTSLANNQFYLGETWEVLVDTVEDGLASGKTRTNRTVRFQADETVHPGYYIDVLIKKAMEWVMEGEMVNHRTRSVKKIQDKKPLTILRP